MNETLIADIRHFLDEDDRLIQSPAPAKEIAEHLALIIEAITRRPVDQDDWDTGINCRHNSCEGSVIGHYDEDDPTKLSWFCLVCNDNGRIAGWQETDWDKRNVS